jgi:hypothetical protein
MRMSVYMHLGFVCSAYVWLYAPRLPSLCALLLFNRRCASLPVFVSLCLHLGFMCRLIGSRSGL